jgi:hypothetical protein
VPYYFVSHVGVECRLNLNLDQKDLNFYKKKFENGKLDRLILTRPDMVKGLALTRLTRL